MKRTLLLALEPYVAVEFIMESISLGSAAQIVERVYAYAYTLVILSTAIQLSEIMQDDVHTPY